MTRGSVDTRIKRGLGLLFCIATNGSQWWLCKCNYTHATDICAVCKCDGPLESNPDNIEMMPCRSDMWDNFKKRNGMESTMYYT